jgi:hypothetical protein
VRGKCGWLADKICVCVWVGVGVCVENIDVETSWDASTRQIVQGLGDAIKEDLRD